MDRRLDTYLRSFRRRSGLTQAELAFLVGIKTSSAVSRLEELQRTPRLSVAFACELIFDVSPIELFPGLFESVRDGVNARVNDLYEELQGDPSTGTRAKLDFLEAVLSRSDANLDQQV